MLLFSSIDLDILGLLVIGMTRIYRWPSRPQRRIPALLHQTCCSVQMTCARWRFIGMWSSIIRNTGGWRSLSQTATYQETTHCGIWWPSTQILQISPSHSASATNLSILTAHQSVRFLHQFCVIHQPLFRLLSHFKCFVSTAAINNPFDGLSLMLKHLPWSLEICSLNNSFLGFLGQDHLYSLHPRFLSSLPALQGGAGRSWWSAGFIITLVTIGKNQACDIYLHVCVCVALLSRWLGHLLGCQILQRHAHARWTRWKRTVGDSLPERWVIHVEQRLGIPYPNCIQWRLLCNAAAWPVPLLAK